MADPRNAACFTQQHWLLRAKGFDIGSWYEAGRGIQNGGILNPHIIDLVVGQRYYRFASVTMKREDQIGGGWWLTYDSLRTIYTYAAKHGYGVSDAARLFLAIPHNWSRIDRLVSAPLALPLRAYAGEGKPAAGDPKYGRADKWTPLQHLRVTQLFIPGLVITGSQSRRQLYEDTFPNPVIEFIHGNRRQV